MKIARHLAAAAAALTLMHPGAPEARAAEAPSFGLSVDAYAAPALDRSVTDQAGKLYQPSRGLVGLATLLSWDQLALGALVDGMPGIPGNGRLSTGALAGWQPRTGSRLYQLLAEIGEERFTDIGGDLPGASSPREAWLGYVGARLGLTETFGRGNPFELGAWLFCRKDLGEATVDSTTASPFGEEAVTRYRLGGYSAGFALRVGVRFDGKKRPGDGAQSERG